MSTMDSKQRYPDIDHLRRCREDGAYHCPKCNYPFTRRSNLRRHYAIHDRNAEHKCSICNELCSSREVLEAHSRLCTNAHWAMGFSHQSNQADDRATWAYHQPLNASIPPFDASAFSYPSPSSISSSSSLEHNTDFDDILASPSLPALIDRHVSNLPHGSPSAFIDPLPVNAPTRSSSNGHTVRNRHGSAPSYTFPQRSLDNAHHQFPFTSHNGAKSGSQVEIDRPLYTQRQVEDMLNMVTNAFMGQMENIFQHPLGGA